MRRGRLLVAGLVAAGLLAACAGDGAAVDIADVRIGQPTGPNAALYLTATSNGEADRLLGASTAAATAVQLHETLTGSDGTMRMARIDGVDLPANGTLVLEPGGYHLMLLDADRLELGEVVEVTTFWETAGEITVEAEVVDPGETMSDDH